MEAERIKETYLMARSMAYSVFSCTVQGPLPRFGTTHSWLDFPTSVINPYTQQACLHANRMEVFYQLRSFIQDNSSFCQVYLAPHQQRT